MHGHGVHRLHRIELNGCEQDGFATTGEGGSGPPVGIDDHAGIAVVQPDTGIVLGDHQRAPHVPLALCAVARQLPGQVTLDLGGPTGDPGGTPPVGAQDPVLIYRFERGDRVSLARPGAASPWSASRQIHGSGAVEAAAGQGRQIRQRGLLRRGIDEAEVARTGSDDVCGRVRVAAADGLGQLGDRATEAPGVGEFDDTARGCVQIRGPRVRSASGAVVGPYSLKGQQPAVVFGDRRGQLFGAGDIGQDRAGLHRGELIGIADQNKPRAGGESFE